MTRDPNDINTPAAPGMMIPGARERNTLNGRRAGSGGFASHDIVIADQGSSMDATTIAAHEREGGGAPDQRTTTPLPRK